MTKFRYEDKVKIIDGFFRECYGIVIDCEPFMNMLHEYAEKYQVVINKNKSKKQLWHKAVWIPEKYLELDNE